MSVFTFSGIGFGASGKGILCKDFSANWAKSAPIKLPTATNRISYKIRASKGDQAGQPHDFDYAEMLQRREYELWQRQSHMYEMLLEQHDKERDNWHQERERWARQEASLKQEVAELRAQLLYVLSNMTGPASTTASVAAGSASSRGSAAYNSQQAQQPSALSAQSTMQLPLGASGMSPAEQVRAVLDAVRSGAAGPARDQQQQQQPDTNLPGGGSSFVPKPSATSSAPPPNQSSTSPLPRYAAELAAAVAAVDEMDVLSDSLDFGALADRWLSSSMDSNAGGEEADPLPAARAAQQHPAPTPQAPSTPTPTQTPEPASPGIPAPGDSATAFQDPAADPAAASPATARGASGPRPTLVSGSEDLVWISQLHRSLVEAGYYPGDDDVEDFFFGETTVSAVMTLQACEGLPETGVVDEKTWEVLLGPQPSITAPPQPQQAAGFSPLVEPSTPPAAEGSHGGVPATPTSPDGGKAYQELFSQAASGAQRAQQQGEGGPNGETLGKWAVQLGAAAGAAEQQLTAWPVLMEGDGGKEVHALHVALEQQGYYASEDDMRWWQFGDSTLAALKTFQACSGLPESGVADPGTWLALLGTDASPSDLGKLRSGDSADEDLSQDGQGRVWLMGEQRWEDRSRLKKE